MTSITGTRRSDDGLSLFTRHWPAANPRAAIVLVHGLAEHSGRYEHVGSALVERGFDVRATDLRGFGASAGARAHVEDFSTYTADLVADVAEARQLEVPVVLLGHSMGSLISILYAQSDHPQPDLLVLSAAAIDANLPKAKLAAARVLVRIAPRLQMPNGLKGDQLSTDPAVGERYFADPQVHPRSTVRLGLALVAAMERSRRDLTRISLPTLVIHGGEDTVVPPSISEPLGALTGATRVVFDGFRHEPFNEDGGDLAITTVADWIDAQL
jgi:alpha-beta hydrolase superfamily lysophospholipase